MTTHKGHPAPDAHGRRMVEAPSLVLSTGAHGKQGSEQRVLLQSRSTGGECARPHGLLHASSSLGGRAMQCLPCAAQRMDGRLKSRLTSACPPTPYTALATSTRLTGLRISTEDAEVDPNVASTSRAGSPTHEQHSPIHERRKALAQVAFVRWVAWLRGCVAWLRGRTPGGCHG